MIQAQQRLNEGNVKIIERCSLQYRAEEVKANEKPRDSTKMSKALSMSSIKIIILKWNFHCAGMQAQWDIFWAPWSCPPVSMTSPCSVEQLYCLL